MVTASGFAHAPVTKALILTHIAASVATSAIQAKHLLPVRPVPHLWPYLQVWRLVTFQVAATSSTEVLFASALLYQLRVLERVWGSRKYASFVVACGALNAVLAPLLLSGLVRPLTWGTWEGYLPAGLAGVVCAGIAAWSDEVPRLYRYKVVGSGSGSGSTSSGIVLSDKSTTYLLALQLALSQFPYTLLPATIGALLGFAWSADLLPAPLTRWRIPRWILGDFASPRDRERYEELRRRLLEEEGSGAADGDGDGMRNVTNSAAAAAGGSSSTAATTTTPTPTERSRPLGRQVLDYFRGVF